MLYVVFHVFGLYEWSNGAELYRFEYQYKNPMWAIGMLVVVTILKFNNADGM